jgi:hypothetical protein
LRQGFQQRGAVIASAIGTATATLKDYTNMAPY